MAGIIMADSCQLRFTVSLERPHDAWRGNAFASDSAPCQGLPGARTKDDIEGQGLMLRKRVRTGDS